MAGVVGDKRLVMLNKGNGVFASSFGVGMQERWPGRT
jgi:hypothetical protein